MRFLLDTHAFLWLKPLELPHIVFLEQLPAHHKDPFDRIIISQASIEDMTVISADQAFAEYPVRVAW